MHDNYMTVLMFLLLQMQLVRCRMKERGETVIPFHRTSLNSGQKFINVIRIH
jgi:hypothetical protein